MSKLRNSVFGGGIKTGTPKKIIHYKEKLWSGDCGKGSGSLVNMESSLQTITNVAVPKSPKILWKVLSNVALSGKSFPLVL